MTTATLLSLNNHPHTLKMVHGATVAEEEEKKRQQLKKLSRRKIRESLRFPEVDDSEESSQQDDHDRSSSHGDNGYGHRDLPSFMVGQFPRIRILGGDGKMQDVIVSDTSERSVVRTAAIRSAKKGSAGNTNHNLRKKLAAEIVARTNKMNQEEKQQNYSSGESSEEQQRRGTLRTLSLQQQQQRHPQLTPKQLAQTRGTLRTFSSPSLLMQPPDRSRLVKRSPSLKSNGTTSAVVPAKPPPPKSSNGGVQKHDQTKIWLEQVVRPAMQKHQQSAVAVLDAKKPRLKRAESYRGPVATTSPEKTSPRILTKAASLRGPALLPTEESAAEKKQLKLKRSQSYNRSSGFAPRLRSHPELDERQPRQRKSLQQQQQPAADLPVSAAKTTEERRAALARLLKPRECSLKQIVTAAPLFAEPRHLYFAQRRISKRFVPDNLIHNNNKKENPAYFLDEETKNRPKPQRRPLPDILVNGAGKRPSVVVQWYSCPECQHRMASPEGAVALQCPHCRTVVLPMQ